MATERRWDTDTAITTSPLGQPWGRGWSNGRGWGRGRGGGGGRSGDGGAGAGVRGYAEAIHTSRHTYRAAQHAIATVPLTAGTDIAPLHVKGVRLRQSQARIIRDVTHLKTKEPKLRIKNNEEVFFLLKKNER